MLLAFLLPLLLISTEAGQKADHFLERITCKFCWTKSDPIQRFEQLVAHRYFGQTQAVKLVKGHLSANILQEADRTSLALHFSGPTGVGKTYLALLIAEAMYGNINACGFLHIHIQPAGYQNLTVADRSEKAERLLLRPIVEQLLMCSRSVILIDDIQHMDIQIVAYLKSAFDASQSIFCLTGDQAGVSVSTKNAIFLLASDFQTAKTRKILAESNSEIIETIKAQVEEQWSDAAGCLGWITIVPFLPLLEDDIHAIILYFFHKFETDIRAHVRHKGSNLPFSVNWIGTVFVEDGVIDSISKQLNRMIGVHGIQNYIGQYAYGQLEDISKQLTMIARNPKTKTAQTWWFLPTSVSETRVVPNNVKVSIDKAQELAVEVDWRSSYHEEL